MNDVEKKEFIYVKQTVSTSFNRITDFSDWLRILSLQPDCQDANLS
jgi:hypothetical protein